jgi:hypothetical protein
VPQKVCKCQRCYCIQLTNVLYYLYKWVVQIKEGYCRCAGKTQGCVDHCLGTRPSKSELQKIKDTTYKVGALRFCLRAASLEIWGIVQKQISNNCDSLSFSSSCEGIITQFTERAKMKIPRFTNLLND